MSVQLDEVHLGLGLFQNVIILGAKVLCYAPIWTRSKVSFTDWTWKNSQYVAKGSSILEAGVKYQI